MKNISELINDKDFFIFDKENEFIPLNSQLAKMKIYLLDRNIDITNSWANFFNSANNVNIICSDFKDFMNTHKVECIVSPANGYGLMDGEYDYAISEWFGWDLQKKVQKYIINNLYGEQPVGTSIILDTGKDGIKLIHTPTMRYPDKIRDPLVIYQCMRTCLITAINNDIESIVIPAFGGCIGCVKPCVITEMMWRTYKQLSAPPTEITWKYADTSYFRY